MRFKNLLVLMLAVSLLLCCGTVIASAEEDSSSPASSAAPVSSETAEPSSEAQSQPQSSEVQSSDLSSDSTSSDITSSATDSSNTSSAASTTTSRVTSSRYTKPNVGTYTDNPDTGSDLGLASDGSFSFPSSQTSSVQTTAGNKNINTNLLTKWLFIPVIFAALSVAGLVYVNYTAHQKKQEEMMHSDFDLSNAKRRKPKKKKSGRRRL